MTLGRRWAFGSSTFDERSLQLVVDGEIVDLERKPLEVLVHLLHHAGDVVTKDDLLTTIWQGRPLSETVLTRCISLLRQALKDESREIIQTAHGYGYRLAIAVRVEVPPALTLMPLQAGAHPPFRPQWKLVERLGSGDHTETWLARREDESRVFKIARDNDALPSLKREVAVYRVLHRALGDNAPVVRFYDWNLEQAPYFIEAEYVENRDLASWAEATGGIARLASQQRLQIATQIVDAVAAIHSAGVVHGNLKPANVLVRLNGDGYLAIGFTGFVRSFVDSERLTQLGMVVDPLKQSAPSLYSAPEMSASTTPSCKTDIYSAGVLLYQLAVAHLDKTLAPGWESEINDEILQADIADAAAGNPARRLFEADVLAQRLKTLEPRRLAREAQRLAQERAERTGAALSELRRVRLYAVALFVLVTVAVSAGVAAIKARNEAIAVTESAKSVNDFLMEDVLRVDPANERPRDASYESLLDHAASQADKRFTLQPEAAATVHWLLGRRYQEIGVVPKAIRQYEDALAQFTTVQGRFGQQTMLVLDRLMPLYVDHGKRGLALHLADELARNWALTHGATNLSSYMVQLRRARILIFGGELREAERQLRNVIDELPHAQPARADTRELLRQWFGSEPKNDADIPELLSAYANMMLGVNVQTEFGSDPRDATRRVRQASAAFSRILGEKAETTALAQVGLGFVLTFSGEFEEANQILTGACAFYDSWLPPKHFYRSLPRLTLAKLRLEQNRPADARLLLEEALVFLPPETSPPARAETLSDLGLALDSMGKHRAAIEAFREALATYERIRGPGHVVTLKVRMRLAEALRAQGNLDESLSVLSATDPKALATLSNWHPVRAEMGRVEGLIALQRRDFQASVGKLDASLEIFARALGTGHWRTVRAREELTKARTAAQRAGIKTT